MSTAAPTSRSRRPVGRVLRSIRRAVLAGLALSLVVTVAAVAYVAATRPPDTLAAPDGADVTVDGVRVHYREWGSRGTPIVLVHGFAESTVSWQPMAEHLAPAHRVVALDLAGYGYTQYDGRYELRDQTRLVAGLVEALHLDRPVLVGHSLGAAVVGSVALTNPGLVRGVIFADGDALPFGDPNQPARARSGGSWLVGTPWFTAGYRLATRTAWLDERIVRRVCGSQCDGLTPRLVDAWMRPMRQGDAERALRTMAASSMLALSPAQVRAIRVPRAIVWGAEDATGGGSLDAARADLGNPPEHVIAHAGHLSMLAKPAEFAQAVDRLAAGMP